MSRNSNNSVLKDIQTEERLEKRLEKIAKAKAKTCHSKEDREINSNGYKYGYEGLSIPEEFKDNGVFISGYERGKRTKKIEDYLKNKKIIEQMVKDNITLDRKSVV